MAITQCYLKKRLYYNESTGAFTWRTKSNRNGADAGSTAGSKKPTGYISIQIDGHPYYAHRLVWLYVYGYFPEKQIDHINRTRYDNRLKNLREVSPSCNNRNSKQMSTCTSGVTGVRWCKRSNKWIASIGVYGKLKHIGRFASKLEAACHRHSAEFCLGWHTCSITSSAWVYIKTELKEPHVRE